MILKTKMLNKITIVKCQFILDIFLKRKTAVVLQIYNVTKVPIFALCFSFNILRSLEEGTGFLSELSSTYQFDSIGTFTGALNPFGQPTITIQA